MITVVRADSTALWAHAHRLLEEYESSLDFDLAFQDYDHELSALETDYGAPDGAFFVAEHDGHPVGCVGVRRFGEDSCEMKRLFVRPRERGAGVGRRLAEAAIAEARRLGYRSMLLDTVPSMTAARSLYASLGFLPRSAYRHNPIPGASFMELDLISA